jgi:phage-related protein
MTDEFPLKLVVWVGSSHKDLREFPGSVQDHMGYALFVAQQGGKHRDAKILQGFGGSGVLEVITNHQGDTFRAVYTVRFKRAVYVLHAFQKKSKSGIKTAQHDVELIQQRLKEAERIAAGSKQ